MVKMTANLERKIGTYGIGKYLVSQLLSMVGFRLGGEIVDQIKKRGLDYLDRKRGEEYSQEGFRVEKTLPFSGREGDQEKIITFVYSYFDDDRSEFLTLHKLDSTLRFIREDGRIKEIYETTEENTKKLTAGEQPKDMERSFQKTYHALNLKKYHDTWQDRMSLY